MADTTVWGYRPTGFDPATAPVQNTYLGNAFLIQRGTKTQVTWRNNLGGVAHPMPVDPSLHWANPLGFVPPAPGAYPVNPLTGISTFDYTLTKIPIVSARARWRAVGPGSTAGRTPGTRRTSTNSARRT